MGNLYLQLVQDHKTLSKVLNVLEQAVSHFSPDSAEEPNLALILEILEYIQSYPEKFHHPLEEQAFNYLLTHQLGDEAIINSIQQQHKSLEKETLHICNQFNAIANDYVVPMPELHQAITHYISAQKHHLNTENTTIFPVLATLDDQAWWDIASGLILKGDPLLETDPERESFTELATAIIQSQLNT